MRDPMLPVAPLVRAVTARGGMTALLPETYGTALLSHREVRAFRRNYMRRVRVGTVTVEWADRFCLDVLGELPELVFGEHWWATVSEEVAA